MRILLLVSAVLLSALPFSKANPLYTRESLSESESETVEDIDDGNAWEKSGFFEGDIILDDDHFRNGRICKDNSCRWPNKTVPYTIWNEYNDKQKSTIKAAIDEYHKKTCIRFRPATPSDRSSILFKDNKRGCSSLVGRRQGGQTINLAAGCFHVGTIVHEILHALGFHHQHSASDRDKFVKINWENIQKGMEYAFNKYGPNQVTDYGVPYDYGSVMHYGPKAFSKNRQPTITPLKSGVTIGQSKGLSPSDIKKLHKMYGCPVNNNDEESDSEFFE